MPAPRAGKNHDWGWKSYRGVLSLFEVKDVASDIATVTRDFLHQRILVEGAWGDGPTDRAEQEFEYVSEYLDEAKAFVQHVADDDRAIVYYIG